MSTPAGRLRGRGRGPALLLAGAVAFGCSPGGEPIRPEEEEPYTPVFHDPATFVMGADLSYVRQVLDHGGTYRDSAGPRSPYAIFADGGANTVRLRLWHDPSWVRTDVYDDPSVPLYSGLEDVASAIAAARQAGMEVLLDIHYSDVWADPGRQDVPAAWLHLTELGTVADSVYQYTRWTLETLDHRGLLPEAVQVGNETSCGILSTGAGAGFPALSVCAGFWESQAVMLNAATRAVRDVAPETRVVLHVPKPETVSWWFDAITDAGVTDFDVIGVSYYSCWSDVPVGDLSEAIAGWRQRYGRDVMVVETAYPWTLQGADGYTNILGSGCVVAGYPATPAGQRDFMIALVQEVIDGGGIGVFYWEPAWITSGMRDLWGTGSAWDNATLFDFQGAAHEGFAFYTYPYDL